LPDEILYFRNDGSAKCKSRKLKSVIEDAEKIHIESILTETNWNRKLTAKILGIDIATLYRKIEKYKI
jgi:transcriptional regulator with PAS, ATPase and Fis domain